MPSRTLTVTVAAILMALFSLINFPGPWWYAIPGAMEETPIFIIYSGIVLGIAGIVAAVGLWMLKPWGFWLTIVVCVTNILLLISAEVAKRFSRMGSWTTNFQNRLAIGAKVGGSEPGNSKDKDGSSRR